MNGRPVCRRKELDGLAFGHAIPPHQHLGHEGIEQYFSGSASSEHAADARRQLNLAPRVVDEPCLHHGRRRRQDRDHAAGNPPRVSRHRYYPVRLKPATTAD